MKHFALVLLVHSCVVLPENGSAEVEEEYWHTFHTEYRAELRLKLGLSKPEDDSADDELFADLFLSTHTPYEKR